MAKSYAVLGLGRFGKELALQLARGGADVLAVDRDRNVVEDVADEVTRAVTADLKDKDALLELGVAQCDEVILSVGSDLSASVLALMNLKAIGVRHLICKAYDEVHREILLKLGADRVLIPEQEFAGKLAAQMLTPGIRDYLQLTERFSILEISAPEIWHEKTLGHLNIRGKYNITVITIRRGETVIPSPGADETIRKDDILVLAGMQKDLAVLRQLR